MPERPTNPAQPATTPPDTPVTTPLHSPGIQDHSFSVQYLHEIHRSLGRIEGAVSKLESAQSGVASQSDLEAIRRVLERLTTKVEANGEQIAAGRGMLTAVKWFLGGIGALMLALLGILAHHFGYM